MADAQARVLAHLTSGKYGGWTTQLVAKLRSPALGNDGQRGAVVFVPDVHLLSPKIAARFPNYPTNSLAVLYGALFALTDARAELRSAGSDLEAVQIGDLFDLWREEYWSTRRDAVQQITTSHGDLLKQLYVHPSGLCARVLVGNHDADMQGTPGFHTHVAFPSDDDVRALAIHGHTIDPKEGRPEWLSRFAVWMGNRHRATAYPIAVADVDAALDARAKTEGYFTDHLELAEPAPLDAFCDPTEIADEIGVRRTSRPKDGGHELLPGARDLVGAMHAQGFADLSLLIVGHTHHARIVVDDAGPTPFVLVDTGAWIEKYVATTPTGKRRGPNCQITVLTAGEVRIYQLDPG